MKRSSITLVAVGALALGAGVLTASAGDKESKGKLPLCPVMGEPIDFTVKASTDQGPVFFCCPGCIKKFEKDEKKYAEKFKAQREALAKRSRIQVGCPMSGEPVDKKATVEYKGQTIRFCCNQCVEGFKKDPSKYMHAVAGSYTYQTLCPVMGEEIDPKVYTTLKTGEKVYFCCKMCIEKFLAKPKKYVAKLHEQGYGVKPKDVVKVTSSGK